MKSDVLPPSTGLSQTSLQAVSKLLDSPEYAEDVISVMRCVITQFTVKDLESESIEVPVHVKLWRVNGCHELLASLGEWQGREAGRGTIEQKN